MAMDGGEGPFRVSWISRVRFTPHSQISAVLDPATPHKLLHRMTSLWTFHPRPAEQTLVHFRLEMAFYNPLTNLLVRRALPLLGRQMIHAFVRRAGCG
jgi:ribosome-associated toxin RatA of RatAB toxin-antitoxin module